MEVEETFLEAAHIFFDNVENKDGSLNTSTSQLMVEQTSDSISVKILSQPGPAAFDQSI